MDTGPLLLSVVVATAFAFAFTNGFHDTANAMATSIATGALPARAAVTLSALLNFLGAFLSLKVASTIAQGIVDAGAITMTVIFAGLVGGLLWNLVTWYLGAPTSSSHALIGGVVGAALIAAGTRAVKVGGLVADVLLPALVAPLAAVLVAGTGTLLVYRIVAGVSAGIRERGLRIGQVGAASLVSLAHGTNDAQNAMGIVTLALIVNGTLGRGASPPVWVIVSSAAAIALGTYAGGWRIIRTMGKGLTDIERPQGFTAEGAAAALVLAATQSGFPLSTTHVSCGSIVGAGMGRGRGRVRWKVVAKIAAMWLVTLPAAALVGAAAWLGARLVGGAQGTAVVFVGVLIIALGIYVAADLRPVNASNVNAVWTGGTPAAPYAGTEPGPTPGTPETSGPGGGPGSPPAAGRPAP
ncbi:phosphate transporter [Streptosporangium violaceochromogenes]|nr:phosphate transporter [Streptosporangium violaceochromogenes]